MFYDINCAFSYIICPLLIPPHQKTEISIPVFPALILLSVLFSFNFVPGYFSSSNLASFSRNSANSSSAASARSFSSSHASLLHPHVLFLLRYSFVQPVCPSFLHVQIRFPYHSLQSRPSIFWLLHLGHSHPVHGMLHRNPCALM